MCGPQIKINEASYRFIKETCASFNNNPGELINVLHKTQEHFGYLPEEVQQVVADCLGIPVGKVYGVVSFYSFFTMKPKRPGRLHATHPSDVRERIGPLRSRRPRQS